MRAALQKAMNISHFHFICNLRCSEVCVARYHSAPLISLFVLQRLAICVFGELVCGTLFDPGIEKCIL